MNRFTRDALRWLQIEPDAGTLATAQIYATLAVAEAEERRNQLLEEERTWRQQAYERDQAEQQKRWADINAGLAGKADDDDVPQTV